MSNMGQMIKVGKVATKIIKEGDTTCVKYHNTVVVKFDDKQVRLDSGGWRTVTTKLRMNQTARQFGLEFGVWQENWEWFVQLPDKSVVDFEDGMEFDRCK